MDIFTLIHFVVYWNKVKCVSYVNLIVKLFSDCLYCCFNYTMIDEEKPLLEKEATVNYHTSDSSFPPPVTETASNDASPTPTKISSSLIGTFLCALSGVCLLASWVLNTIRISPHTLTLKENVLIINCYFQPFLFSMNKRYFLFL